MKPTALRQRGSALIIVLLLGVIVALMALSAFDGSATAIRSTASEADRNSALQAAEAALRDAEDDIAANITPSSGFSDACNAGLCRPPQSGGPLFVTIDWADDSRTRRYGQYTGAVALASVSAQPRYVIEPLATLPPSRGESVAMGAALPASGEGAAGSTIYRVTAFASGALPGTRVFLQSTVVKPN